MKPLSVIVCLLLLTAATAAAQDDGTRMNPTEDAPAANKEEPGLSWGQVGALVVSVVAASGGAYTVGKSRAVKIDPQPLKVETAQEYATRSELEQLRSYVNIEIGKTSKRLDRALEAVANVNGTLSKMDTVQQQILELLLKRHD